MQDIPLERILEEATELWSAKGYQASTMSEIARGLGMSLKLLHECFPTKQDLVLQLYHHINDEVSRRLETRQPAADAEKSLLRFMEVKLEVLQPYKPCCIALLQEVVDPYSVLNPLSRQSAPVLDRSLKLFADLLENSGVKDAAQVAHGLWLAHLSVLFCWVQDHSEDSQLTRQLMKRFCSLPKLFKMKAFLPGLGDLLNTAESFVKQTANSREAEVLDEACDLECEVAVIGAGPVGLLYACWLKQSRPQTQVVVLEKSSEPGYKVGESTLSGFCKALRSIGIPHSAMQRLFFPKNGLGFFFCDQKEREIEKLPEYILETFDETFQVEREMLESLMLERAQQLGVKVFRGAKLDLNRSSLSTASSLLHYRIGTQAYRLHCNLVADASGPQALLARHHGQYTRSGLSFQTGAVWSAYRTNFSLDKLPNWSRVSQFPRDEYTQHFCFPEGWMWYIPVVSWSQAPLQNREQVCRELLRSDKPASRTELGKSFACPHEEILSLGLVLRDDRDLVLKEDPASAFEHYAQKYPALGTVLNRSTLLKDYLGEQKSFSSRLNLRGWSRRVTGDGWLSMGDAAFFVDPLISPGMTAGAATAYFAAQETLRALESDCWHREEFGNYEDYIHRLHQAHERDSQLVSRSFNHPRSLALVQRFQEIDARRHFETHQDSAYGWPDTDVWGLLRPEYQQMQRALWEKMTEHEQRLDSLIALEEQSPTDYQPMIDDMEALLMPYLREHSRLNPYTFQNEVEAVC
jgi:flavin-dependent dehydrogenase/AcrR family transcriptional regulator